MRHTSAVRGCALTTLGVVGFAACAQLIGVQAIPVDAGLDGGAGGLDALADRRAPRSDAGDALGDAAVKSDGADRSIEVCESGATRCSSDGLGMETCVAGIWGPRTACSGATPICLGASCTCEPGRGQCSGSQAQQWQRCQSMTDGAAPTWIDVDAACPGTCTLTGCAAEPASCAAIDAGSHTCGVNHAESCCTSLEVPGGTFDRSYDDYSTDYFSTYYPATVSGFRLDRFEVSVERFGRFVQALTGISGQDSGATGFRPAVGSGKHAHLNSGQGLAAIGGGYEGGWEDSWNGQLEPSFVTHQISTCVNPGLVSYDPTSMDPAAGFLASSPMNCVTWAQAYAFCIWDGGFLPSEAEWNYAAAGGADQRVYPWSAPVDAGPDGGIDCAHAVYVGEKQQCYGTVQPVGSHSPQGDGKWGQADLAGNVLEWTLDGYGAPYATPCVDCANLSPAGTADADATLRVQRGGAFVSSSTEVLASFRGFSPAGLASYAAGFRCARSP